MTFIKMIRGSPEMMHLVKHDHNALALLILIAQRARYSERRNLFDLEVGEALMGDHREAGMTRGAYRHATKRLVNMGFATIRTTTKGTVFKLIDSSVFDLNIGDNDHQSDQTATNEVPSNDQRGATNKEGKEGKEGKRTSTPYEKILENFHFYCKDLPRVRSINGLKPKLKARWKEHPEIDWWVGFFQDDVHASDFLCGRSSDFRASLDWILGPKNMSKILNGQYQNRKQELSEADQVRGV